MNNLSLVNIFGETGRFFCNINYMLNSEHLSLVNKIGDKTEFTITRVHCISLDFLRITFILNRKLKQHKMYLPDFHGVIYNF